MPLRQDNLFDRIANFQALHAAARRAIKGKRKKPGAAAFFANLEGELHTFANRIGKGTHQAIDTYERYRDHHDHVLRCDIYRYFPAIDHAILKSDFRRRIACPSTLALLDLIVDCSNPQEPVALYFDGDDLFDPFRRRRGLPIGNLTSQFFANLYLDGFDHFVTEVLGIRLAEEAAKRDQRIKTEGRK